jgi:hypothetical protein
LLGGRVKATFYAERALVAALDRDAEEHERLGAWLPGRRVERKREDALALLRAIRHDLDEDLAPFRPLWTLQRTRYWEEARRSVELAESGEPGPTADATLEALLDEARLDAEEPDVGETTARELGRRHRNFAELADSALLSAVLKKAALEEERRARGLLEPEDVDTWLDERDLDRDDLPDVARRLAALRWARDAHRDAVAGEVALALRSDDAYAGLAARATRKRDVLASLPSDRATPADVELVEWYFRERVGREAPVALDAWAIAHGWRRVAASCGRSGRVVVSCRRRPERRTAQHCGRPHARGQRLSMPGGTAEAGRRPTT